MSLGVVGPLLRNRRAGPSSLLWACPEAQGPETILLSSPACRDGEPLPDRYRGRAVGLNLSPPLAWSAIPPETVELVLVVEDPDAPRRRAPVHGVVRGIEPTVDFLPEGALARPSPVPGLIIGKGLLGQRTWVGPMPLRAHGPHHYTFQLYALDLRLEVPSAFTRDDVRRAMAGHVVGRGVLVGTYER